MSNEMYDITIIGGGPAGLFAGFYAGMRTAKVQIIESLEQLGGQVSALYPEKSIHDVGGYPGIKALDLAQQLEKQVRQLPVDIRIKETVTNVSKLSDMEAYQIVTDKDSYQTKSIVIATGNGAFQPRKLAIENGESLEDKHLFYHVPDLHRFEDQRVMVAGGGDSAIDIALMLEPIAKEVILVHRRDEFRAMEHSVQLLQNSEIQTKTPFLIKAVKEENNHLAVELDRVRSDETETIEVDDVLVNYGFTSSNKIIKNWDIQPEQKHRMFLVDNMMQTSIPNIYSIGDGIEYPGKLRLIATAFGEGPVAINQIMNNLYPGKRGPLHSTSMFQEK